MTVTPHQRRAVLALLVAGRTTAAISDAVGLPELTVEELTADAFNDPKVRTSYRLALNERLKRLERAGHSQTEIASRLRLPARTVQRMLFDLLMEDA